MLTCRLEKLPAVATPNYMTNLCLEDENDGEEDEEHEEVYAEDYDDTDHSTKRKQASLPHLHSYPTQ
jgi:hypothetical protein